MSDEKILRRAAKAVIAWFGCFAILTSEWAIAESPPPVEWIRQLGSSRNDRGTAVTVDDKGSVYVSGTTDGSLAGPSAGSSDVFLAKFDWVGAQLFSRQIGTAGSDTSWDMALGRDGRAYISGNSNGNNGAPSYSAFLANCDATGALESFRLLNAVDLETSTSVSVDGEGNMYVSRNFRGSIYPQIYDINVFLDKYDVRGSLLWSHEFGSAKTDVSRGMAVDDTGNAYVVGRTDGNLSGTNSGNGDAFIARFDPAGTHLWLRQIGTAWWDEGIAVAVDGNGNAYVGGITAGKLRGQNFGGDDVFLAKYGPDGTELWIQQFGTSAIDLVGDVAVDELGNVYISGTTYGNLAAGPNAGNGDVFLAKYDPLGTRLWLQQVGTAAIDFSAGMAVDKTGAVWITGETLGRFGVSQFGSWDAFLIKFGVPEPSLGVLVIWGVFGMAAGRRRRAA